MARLSLVFSSLILAVTSQRAAAVLLKRSPVVSSGGKKRVAFAAFVTGLSGEAWEDAAAVLAHGIHETGRRSRHDVEAVALAPESLPDDVEKTLLALGFDKVFKRPVPVQAEEVRDANTKRELEHIQGNGIKGASFSLVEEGIKYQALGLTEYDRVLILDLDTMILQPMDAIIDAKEDLVGTYDVAMESNMHNAVPVVQGGFLLVRTNVSDLEEIKRTTREGTFNGGGWQNSHIGYAYGGVGPQGMFSYHYHRDLLPTLNKYSTDSQERKELLAEVDPEHTQVTNVEGKRFLALDRRAYDVLDTPFTQAELNGEDIKVTIGRVRSAHFTGGCGKPWSCGGPGSELCKGLTNEWWNLRSSLAASWGVPETARCEPGGHYTALARPKVPVGSNDADPASLAVVTANTTVHVGLHAPGAELIFDGPFMMYAAHHLETGAQLTEQVDDPKTDTGIAFNAQTGLVVVVAFGMMLLYSQWHESIARYTGLQLAHVCCLLYSSISVSIDISIKNAAVTYGGTFPFNPACGVVVVEYAKLIASVVLFAVHVRDLKARGDILQLPTRKDVGWLALPAGIYAISNLICFQAIKSTPLATFGVVRETMLVWNAFFWSATFGQGIGSLRWLAIMGIFIGCSLNQIPLLLNDDLSSGVLWTCLLAITNAGGGVINEYAMKQSPHLDINLQNSIMYALCGTFVLTGIAIFNHESVQSANAFFTGFVPECWTVIALQAFAGLAVSRILKYVEAVTKTIAAALRGPGVIFLGAVFFHKHLRTSEIAATFCVCISCGLYLRQGPLTPPKVASETMQSDCKLGRAVA